MTEKIKARQTIQQELTGLKVHIPKAIAKAAHISAGHEVTLEVTDYGILVRTTQQPEETLAQRLEAFKPEIHGGEFPKSQSLKSKVK